MDNYKQLYEKANEEYKKFYPLTDILSIIDKESGKNLKQLLNQYNHIKLDWKGNTVGTRNSVPLILRHKGLFVTYDTGSNIVTEYYTGDDISASINTIWQNDNNWTNFSIAAGFADQEDITEVNGKFKFADRNHNAAQFTGMGRVILRKNLVDVGGGTVKNVLTQDMINKSNTIYEIRYDYDLNGEEITIPEGCVLDFQGGCFSNGTIVGNNAAINASLVQIFGLDIEIQGQWNISEWYPEWYGAKGDGLTDDTAAIQKLNKKTIRFSGKVYAGTNLLFNACTNLIGSGKGTVQPELGIEENKTILKQLDGSSGDFITMEDWYLGNIENLTIIGGKNITEVNLQQALVKIRTTKEFIASVSPLGYKYRAYSWCSNINNITIEDSEYNGISYLSNGDIDNGVNCSWNWIINTSNIWVLRCKRYCMYSKATDNRYSNMHLSFSGWANFYLSGGGNIINNLKLDGESAYYAMAYIKEHYEHETEEQYYEELLNNDLVGAALIVNSDYNLISNLDVQSGCYVGVKIVRAINVQISGIVSNNGKKNEELYYKYLPGIAFKRALSCQFNIIGYHDDFQAQFIRVIGDLRYISSNTFNFNSDIYSTISRHRLIVDEINKLRGYNVVNVNFIDASFEKKNSIYKLSSLTSSWYDNFSTNIATEGTKVENALFDGERGITITPEQGDLVLNFNRGTPRVKRNHLYLLTAIQKVENVASINNTDLTRAYFEILKIVDGAYKKPSFSWNMSLGGDIIKAGDNFVWYHIVKFTEDFDYSGATAFRMWYKGKEGKVTVSNVNMYDLTQDLGVTDLATLNNDAFVKNLFSYSGYDDGLHPFRDLEVSFPNNNIVRIASESELHSNNDINGEMIYNKSAKKPYYNYNGTFFDAAGIPLGLSLKGPSNDRPSKYYNLNPFTMYFDESYNRMVWFIDGKWVDAMGEVIPAAPPTESTSEEENS